jgi:hypothetical protein
LDSRLAIVSIMSRFAMLGGKFPPIPDQQSDQ